MTRSYIWCTFQYLEFLAQNWTIGNGHFEMSLLPQPRFSIGGGRKTAEAGSGSLTDIFDDFLFPDGVHGNAATSNPSGNLSADEDDDDGDGDSCGADEVAEIDGKKKRKRVRGQNNLSEEQKLERR